MPLSGIISQAQERMKQAAQNDLNAYLNGYRQEIASILGDLLSYRELDSSFLIQSRKQKESRREYWLEQSAQDSARGWLANNMEQADFIGEQRALYNSSMSAQAADLKYVEAMKRGYKVLNNIGETIRGKEITYTIIVSTQKGSQYHEWTGVKLDDFLDLTTMYANRTDGKLGRTLRLANTKTIMDQLGQVAAGTSSYRAYNKWSKSRMALFNWFNEKIRSKEMGTVFDKELQEEIGRWSKVNRGNVLEGFLRFSKYNMNVKESMLKTMSDPDPFWRGGDLEELYDFEGIQVKSEGASVTNISSLIRQLTKIDNQLSKITSLIAQQSQDSNVNTQQIENQINQEIEELIKEFLSKSLLKSG